MDFYMRLPRNNKEFTLFLAIISILSVNIIAPLITAFEIGFTINTWVNTLRILPFIWVVVVAMVLMIHKPADALTKRIVHEKDSFRSQVTMNILCNVFLMSIFMTVFGTWIGTRSISLDIFTHYFHVWPRNFAVSFAVELLIAQPIARFVLYKIHVKSDQTKTTVEKMS